MPLKIKENNNNNSNNNNNNNNNNNSNNNNWNLHSAFVMPNMIKCTLQFDKVIKNK